MDQYSSAACSSTASRRRPFSSVSCTTMLLGDSMISFGMKLMVTLWLARTVSFLTVRDSIDLPPEISNVRGNGVNNTIAPMACGFLQLVSNTATRRSLWERWRQCWAVREHLANAEVPLNLFEGEIFNHWSQHKDGPYYSEVDGSGIQ